MHRQTFPNSVITIMALGPPQVAFWPVTLLLFSITAMLRGCKPAKPSERYNPYCESNPSVPKVCPLSLTAKCPRLMLSDFSTSQSTTDSHDQANYGLVNWISSIGIRVQSSMIFFVLGLCVLCL